MRNILFIVMGCIISLSGFAQTPTENYILNTTYQQPYNGDFEDFSLSIGADDLFLNNEQVPTFLGNAQITIVNNVLSFTLNTTNWNQNTYRLSNSLHWQIPALTGLNIDLGELVGQNGPTGYAAKINNGIFKLYRPNEVANSNIDTNITVNYTASTAVQYNANLVYTQCFEQGGQSIDIGNGSISIANNQVTLDLDAQMQTGCFVKLGNIQYLDTATLPNIELGPLMSTNGTPTDYKAKIENNWLVFYSDTIAWPTNQVTHSVTENLVNITEDDKIKTIVYYDGLGRPVQNISERGGGQREAIITPTTYDGLGREALSYLPVPEAQQTGQDPLGYRNASNLISDLNAYYTNTYPEDINSISPNPYSETSFEDSPLNRPLEMGAPGTDWAISNGHTIKYAYEANTGTDKVKRFRVIFPTGNTEMPYLKYDGLYEAAMLYKTITKDENWSPSQNFLKDHTTEEFKDKNDRVILKRTYHEDVIHDTQYIYDDFGNLTYVLSPKGSDKILAGNKYVSGTTNFSFTNIGPQNIKGLSGFGGGSIVVDGANSELTVNFDFSFNGSFNLHQGPIKLINSNLPNMYVGTVSGAGYSYEVAILEGYLYLTGTGAVSGLSTSISTTIPSNPIDIEALDELCYQYHYDSRNRLVEKKLPGKGWEYTIYDTLDRPVLVQDANLRVANSWLFTKYDALGRTVYTGKLLNIDDTRQEFQARVNSQAVLHETASVSLNTSIVGYGMYYTNNALQFPNAAISYEDLHSINYYDRYNPQLTAVATDPGMVYEQETTTQTRGLATGSRVKVLDNSASHWITTVSYYDDKARLIYTGTTNNYLGTTDLVKTKLDFLGKVMQTESSHSKGSTTVVVEDTFTYDHAARLLTQVQTVNGGTPELIVNNHYDQLGQLVSKKVGGDAAVVPEQSLGLQTVDYTYNIRGWLKTINDQEHMQNDLFSFKLNYNTKDHSNTEVLFNGNISETHWRTNNIDPITGDVASRRSYGYGYDAMNRITNGDFYKAHGVNQDNRFNLKDLAYDKNGNILALSRTGLSDAGANIANMDILSYMYNGNQLTRVSDTGDTNYGFKAALSDYTYDANGNMTKDTGKGITNIAYNYLNLPTLVTTNQGSITYIYDASGVKLKKIVSEGSNTTATSYAGNYIYKKENTNAEALQFFNHPEGYVEPDGAGFAHVYQYKDHLDNIRLSYKDINDDGVVTGATTAVYRNDFENNQGFTSMHTQYGGAAVISTDNVKHGSHAIKLHKPTSGSAFATSDEWYALNNTVATEYIYSGWIYSNATCTPEIWLVMAQEGDSWSDYNFGSPIHKIRSFVKNKWVYVEGKVTVPADEDYLFFVIKNLNGNGTVWFDDISLRRVNADNTIEIVEENNYYPFGLKHKGYNNVINGTDHPYGFGGKEEQNELGLGWVDITARNYAPELGRWMNLDPLAEEMRRHSPYNYAFDNPIYFIDPDGMMPFGNCCNGMSGIGEGIARSVESKINKGAKWVQDKWSSFTGLFRSSDSRDKRVNASGEGLRGYGENPTNQGSTQDNGESKGSYETKDIPGAPGGHKGPGKNSPTSFQGGKKDTEKVVSFFERGNELVENISDKDSSNNSSTSTNGSIETSNTSGEVTVDNQVVVVEHYSTGGKRTSKPTTMTKAKQDSSKIMSQNKSEHYLRQHNLDSVTIEKTNDKN